MNLDVSSDLLVIGAGYDEQLVSEVAQYKDAARKAIMLGFPSLRADMYQQNILRISRADEVLGRVPNRQRFFAPANDPFVTASVLNEIVSGGAGLTKVTNLYLCPLATKAQALGFVVFSIYHRRITNNVSIIFPFSSEYEKTTDYGISRVWRYVVEFP